jgi:small subunit ribosomal protein S16
MVAIRLRRAGSKKRPFFRVVVTDSRAARDSSFVEILGHYNPRSRPAVVQVNKERLDQWVKKGAQMSNSVRTLVARHLTAPPASAAAGPAAASAPRPLAAASAAANADTVVMARPAASAADSSDAASTPKTEQS